MLRMEFCPKCGSRLIPKKTKTKKKIKISLACRKKCKYEKIVREESVIIPVIIPILKNHENPKKLVAIGATSIGKDCNKPTSSVYH